MLGFFTLVAFVLALGAGGWFWLLFVIMLVAWANKLEAEKKAKASQKDSSSPRPLPAPVPPMVPVPKPKAPLDPVNAPSSPAPRPIVVPGNSGNGRKQLDKLSNWISQLTEVCSRYSASDYYVDVLIPQTKLESALKSYPLQGGGKVIALIDTTILGSADNGLLIWEDGISWHNWTFPTKRSTLRWLEFSELALSIDGSKIKIGNDAVFETAGSQFGANETFSLLTNIGALLDQLFDPDDTESETQPIVTDSPVASPSSVSLVDVNMDSFEKLLKLPGIGAADARLLLKHRESGAFLGSVDEMADLLNLKPHIAKRLEGRVTFSRPKAGLRPAPPSAPVAEPPNRQPGGRTID
jgi:DNA uptake protein ComE-like DNA-binding protein